MNNRNEIALNINLAEKILSNIRNLVDQYYEGIICGYKLMDDLVVQKNNIILELQQVQSKLIKDREA